MNLASVKPASELQRYDRVLLFDERGTRQVVFESAEQVEGSRDLRIVFENGNDGYAGQIEVPPEMLVIVGGGWV